MTWAYYRCFFVDASKDFVGFAEYVSMNDTLAVEEATTLYRVRGIDGQGFEVWQGERMVHRREPHDHSPAA